MFSFLAGLRVLASFNRLLLGSLKRSHPVGPVTALIRVVLVGGAGLKGFSEIRSFADGEHWVLSEGGCTARACAHTSPECSKHEPKRPLAYLEVCILCDLSLLFLNSHYGVLVPPLVAVMVPCVLSTRWSCTSPPRPSHPLSTCLGQAALQMPGCPPDIPIP